MSDPQEVRERDTIMRNHAMRISPVVRNDRPDQSTPELNGHAEELRDLADRLQLQYASTGRSAPRAGAATWRARPRTSALRAVRRTMKTGALQIGNHEHQVERDRSHAKALR